MLDDLSTGLTRNVEQLRDRPGLSPRRRLRALAVRRERARLQVRRRLPPRRRRRRPPDRRAAGAHDGHEPAGHRRPCSSTATSSTSACSIASSSEVYGDHREERPLEENDRRVYGPVTRAPLAVRRLEGDGRVPRARLPPGARPRLRHRPVLQHRRAAPVGPVRDGHPALRRARRRRRAARGARRRHADALLLPRLRHDPRDRRADGGARHLRRDLQRRLVGADAHHRPRAARARADADRSRSSCSCRTPRSTASGSRTCCTASRRSRRSAPRSAGDRRSTSTAILADVIDHTRRAASAELEC